MIHIETIQFTVGGKVDTGLTLEVEHDARGVEQRLLAGQRREPVRDGIRADRGGEDARRVARVHLNGTMVARVGTQSSPPFGRPQTAFPRALRSMNLSGKSKAPQGRRSSKPGGSARDCGQRSSVLECGGPPPLSTGSAHSKFVRFMESPLFVFSNALGP